MEEIAIGSKKKIHCNTCNVDTHHQLEAKHSRSFEDEFGFWEDLSYHFWICQGCDTATLEIVYIDAAMSDGDERHHFFPKRELSDFHLRPKYFFRLNEKLTQIYKEVIKSYNNKSKILCAIGLRALLEGICFDKQIEGKNLYKKIDGLKELLPSNIVENLHGFRFMGNIAAHELEHPEWHELKLAIEVIEDLLNFLYELEYKTQRLPNSSENPAN